MPPAPRVEIYAWNPQVRRFHGRLGRRLPLTRPIDNFGDLLGPLIVEAILRRDLPGAAAVRDAQLLSVGSVIQQAAPGAVVWGSGINGKRYPEPGLAASLDIRAVRGPRTREYLSGIGVQAPAVYGDPALLLGELFPDLREASHTRELTIVPNLNDVPLFDDPRVLHPQRELRHVLATIAASDFVVGSSLHGIIVAEALGIPARLIRSPVEPQFKYDDYYAGTGRPQYATADSLQDAIAMGGEAPPQWAPEPLMQAFPYDLWSAQGHG